MGIGGICYSGFTGHKKIDIETIKINLTFV